MDWADAIRRWGRGALALALLGGLWLLAGPKQEAVSPAVLGGPGLGTARGAAGGGGAGGGTGGSGVAGGGSTPKIKRYVVHVAGAVRRPGVYRVRAPGRLIDAVQRAGGLTADADLTQVNLAARLTDGRQIVVPRTVGVGGVGAGAGSSGAAPDSAGDAGAAGSGVKLSLNSATAEQLQTLDGVGPAMAAAIIEARTKLGGFTKIEQLDEVPGVGEKRLESLRGQLDL